MLLPASGSALTDASNSVYLSCSDGQVPSVTVNEPGSTPLDESCLDSVDFFGASGSRSASATGTVTFGASPTTDTTTNAGTTGFPGGVAASDSITQIQFQLQVTQTATPPVGGITEVPVVLTASGTVTTSVVSGLAPSNGDSYVLLSSPGVSVSEGVGSSSFDSVVTIPNIAIGSAYTLTLYAQCSSDATSAPSAPGFVTNAQC